MGSPRRIPPARGAQWQADGGAFPTQGFCHTRTLLAPGFSLSPATPNNARRSRLRRRGRDARDASLRDRERTDVGRRCTTTTTDRCSDDTLDTRFAAIGICVSSHLRTHTYTWMLDEATAKRTTTVFARRCCLSHDTLNTDSASALLPTRQTRTPGRQKRDCAVTGAYERIAGPRASHVVERAKFDSAFSR